MYRLLLCTALLLTLSPTSQAIAQQGDEEMIRQTIRDAYIDGVFVERSEAAVRAGFHPSFTMAVHDENELIQASLDMWLERMQLDNVKSTDSLAHQFEHVDITGSTAQVKLQLWINGDHTYTDYVGLYRFSDGWKIVNKLFESHGNE